MITGVILAAGAARRFGSQKLLARLPDGRPIVAAAAAALRGECDRLIAVARDDAALIAALRQAGCEVVVNARAAEGMGTSIAAGVAASAESSAWLVALGDMPYLQAPTVRAILAAGEMAKHIVVPTYGQMRGHPVRFPSAVAADLLALAGDTGARAVIDRHIDRLLQFETEDSGVIADIDVPADLADAAANAAASRGQ